MVCVNQDVSLSVVRGGTSRGIFLRARDLPRESAERDALCIELIGSPDPLAVDGLGGGASSNSKIMAVDVPEGIEGLPGAEACPEDVDLVSVFAQVGPSVPDVDWSGNCGNLSSAVSAFALSRGLIRRSGDCATVRVWNLNTASVFELEHALDGGELPRSGDFTIPGAPRPGARIDLRFLAPGGEKTGRALPCGHVLRLPRAGMEVSLVDVTNPVVLVRAADLSVDASQPSAMLNQDAELLDRIEALRQEAGELMGLEPGPANPRVVCLAPSGVEHEVLTRTTSMGVFHHAIPATAAMAVGAAGALGGTLLDEFTRPRSNGDVLIAHPQGTVTVTAQPTMPGDGAAEPCGDDEAVALASVGIARTARVILEGTARVG